ncbi:MAG: hypothetical protein Q9209_003156 [Squamulea sp. 1 TL-2023]
MSTSKKAILFTIPRASVVLSLLDTLRNRNYTPALIVFAPGPNHMLDVTDIPTMGSQVSAVIDTAIDPPPVLCVTNVKQVEAIFLALDPDIAVSFGFGYRIIKKLLAHRSKFVNFHPAQLPMMRGSAPFPWPVIHPEMPLIATWHYMVEELDRGNIIKEIEMALPGDKTRETLTAAEVEDILVGAGLTALDGVLDLVEKGYEGRAQEVAGMENAWGSRPLSDDERTITDDMGVEDVLRLGRALEGSPTRPLLRFNDGLYYITRLTQLKEEDVQFEGTQKRVGTDLIQRFKGGYVRMAIRKV